MCNIVVCVFLNEFIMTHTQKMTVPGAKINKVHL